MDSLSISAIIETLRATFSEMPDGRTGKNSQYAMIDAAAGAFGIFFMQSPSFLAYQRDMDRCTGRNNAVSLFGVTQIPSDQQVRNMLDPAPPSSLYEPFWTLQKAMEESGQLSKQRGYRDTYLIVLDGAYYFSLQAITL